MMFILYKIYAMVLAERLREELEGKQIIPQNQTEFRRGMGTIDNIYVLNYLVNRQIERKGRKMVVLFVDLKAAFDSVDRGVLVREMMARGIRKGFIRRVEEVVRETKNRMKVGENLGDSFCTARGLRQGCPLSPLLLNIVMADTEEALGKVKWGGLKIGERRIYSLAYADDMMLLAEGKGEMRSMMERFDIYLEEKRLELNTSKSDEI